MAEQPADRPHDAGTEPTERPTNDATTERPTDDAKLLGRRDTLKLGAAAAAVAAGAGAASTSAAASVERGGVTFDRVLNAVDDVGMDPNGRNPIDRKLDNALQSGTLLEFPPGEYLVENQHRLRDRVGIVGIGSDRSDVRFTVPVGEKDLRWINFNNVDGALLKDFTIDRRDDYRTGVGMGGNIKDNFRLENVEYDGWTPSCPTMFGANVTDPNGVAVVDGLYRTGPTEFQHYPKSSLDIWSGRGHEGHMVLRNIEIHNGSESGIYTGKGAGTYLIENCYMKNVVHTAIRAAGRDSTIRNCTVVMDTEDWDPRNEKKESTFDDGEPIQLNRGIWAQTNDKTYSGPVIEDCEVIVKNTSGQALAGIYINFDTGGAVIRNTRVQCDAGEVIPIYGQEIRRDAGKPYAMELDGVSVTGSAWSKAAMYFEDRTNSVIENCCISSRNNNDGIVLDNCDGSVVKNTNIDVGGRSTTFRNGRVSTSGITSGDSCPLPSLPKTTPSDGTPSTSDGSTGGSSGDSTDDSSSYDLPYRFRVESKGTGETEFTVSTSGTMKPAASGEGVVENNTVTDSLGPVSGTDSYLYEGHVTDFSATGADNSNYYIETADGSRSVQVSPELLSANTISVKSTGGGKTTFDITVDGEIVRGASGLEDTVDAQTASGRVGPDAGTDVFHYTGSITNLAFEGAEFATVKVNGKEIDPAKYVGGSTTDPVTDLPNTVTIEGTGTSTTYRLTVSEDIAVSPDENDDLSDNVSTKSAEGALTDVEHSYVYSGEITDFSMNGDANVYVNGTQVDPSTLGGNEALPNTLVIDGSTSSAAGTYKVYVSGDIEAAPDLSVTTDKALDSVEDKVFDGKVAGVVEEGKDGFRFSGSITKMNINGDAVVNLG
ncbi:glycosyl hydrolase family 28-related protein [Halogeometricum limi]|uniref:Right handed beta helix region n=1 Tax=Halogeometricum limi TaxID=555875 RepID=A0A1I6IIH8_9EURY|nr:glycosyl hydrolase family 28-related protein [Halogeometricum limi]SFR66542.1 Right handed beta helix region [Halogeometricum limi]